MNRIDASPSANATASRAASSGKHKMVMALSRINCRRASGSLRCASSICSISTCGCVCNRVATFRPVVPASPSINIRKLMPPSNKPIRRQRQAVEISRCAGYLISYGTVISNFNLAIARRRQISRGQWCRCDAGPRSKHRRQRPPRQS